MRHDSDRSSRLDILIEAPNRSPVQTVDTEHGRRLLATRSFRRGAVVLELQGVLCHRPDRYSVQLGPHEHLRPPHDADLDDHRYLWRYLNHSCRPNACFEGRQLRAMVGIDEGSEITFDYESTEETMAEPFQCHCGHCGGRVIRGWRHNMARRDA